jgi:TetR/AcrR family transcriptional repressor of lmrAB and yxaGH operons
VTLEAAAGSPAVRATAAEIFDSWLVVLERRLRTAGLGERAARTRALLVLASLEGALLLARAMHDTSPLAAVREEIVSLSVDAEHPRLSPAASCTPR